MFQRIQGVGLGLLIATAVVALAAFGTSFAQNAPQGTPLGQSFTYQGRLEVDGLPAEGAYDLEFQFWDAANGGNNAATEELLNVPVVNGQFSVLLSPIGLFQGEQVFLAISARPAGIGSYVPIGERQELTPTPYAVYAMTAGELSSTAAASFIQNGTSQQPTSNFNISGNGTAAGTLFAGTVNTSGAYLIGGSRFGSMPGPDNLYLGTFPVVGGAGNTVVGRAAGENIWNGNYNTSVGWRAARNLDDGDFNTAIGVETGENLDDGEANTLVGRQAGRNLDHGSENTLIGNQAGPLTTGSRNTFLGDGTGALQTTAVDNVFVGHDAGKSNDSGSQNVFLGRNAGQANTAGINTFVGFNAGFSNTSGSQNLFLGYEAGVVNTIGSSNTALGSSATFSANNLDHATAVGAGAVATSSNQVQLGRNGTDTVRIGLLAGGSSSTDVCLSATNVLVNCSSSLRYKTNLADYTGGLDILEQLRPVTFDWKSDGTHDLGFVAEEVAAVDPLLATYRDGEVEGVKYDRISAVLVNSVMEQQAQIDALASGVTPADDARLDAIEAAIANGSGSDVPGWLYALAGAVLGSLLLPAARKAAAAVR